MPSNDPKDLQMIDRMAADSDLRSSAKDLFLQSCKYRYSYNFSWLGRPIIQYPEDMMAMQEIIWKVKPSLIIETGIAHGGSLVFYASMLEMIGGNGQILGIDIDIRPHNRIEIENHRLYTRMTMIEGSSIDPAVVAQVYAYAQGHQHILVVLDSNHTHDHVFQELEAYSSLVKKGSYLVVFDTIVEDMPADSFPDRPWGKGNNPKTAVRQFLQENDRFEVDVEYQNKLLLTVAPEGYLKCVKD